MHGKQVLLQVDFDTVCSVLPSWTDLEVADAEVVIGEKRALFCVEDLLALERLVTQLSASQSRKRAKESVREILPPV